MNDAAPSELLSGTFLVAAPHFDDEVLGCGGLLAMLPDKARIHVVYATSGTGSENLLMPGVRVDPALDMGRIRREESLAALHALGVPPETATFLGVRDYAVLQNADRVRAALAALVDRIKPDWVLAPFRLDRHTDHVALNRIVRSVLTARGESPPLSPAGRAPRLLEYFIYYRWKLLPGGDVRAVCRPAYKFAFDISGVRDVKRRALACFASQTTRYQAWQTRPVLSEELLDELSNGPEIYLYPPAGMPDAALFTVGLTRLRLIHWLEPRLKVKKDRLLFLLRRQRR